MADRSVDARRKEQHEHRGGNSSGESPGPRHEETDGDGELQDPKTILSVSGIVEYGRSESTDRLRRPQFGLVPKIRVQAERSLGEFKQR
jgi:hypothetical protein